MDLLHPNVRESSGDLFDRGTTPRPSSVDQGSNSELKKYYQEHTGEDRWPCSSRQMLSRRESTFQIADIKHETGKNRQRGLMQIMQGLFIESGIPSRTIRPREKLLHSRPVPAGLIHLSWTTAHCEPMRRLRRRHQLAGCRAISCRGLTSSWSRCALRHRTVRAVGQRH